MCEGNRERSLGSREASLFPLKKDGKDDNASSTLPFTLLYLCIRPGSVFSGPTSCYLC